MKFKVPDTWRKKALVFLACCQQMVAKHITESLHEGLGWIPPCARIIGVWMWDGLLGWDCEIPAAGGEIVRWEAPLSHFGPQRDSPFFERHSLTRPAAPYCPLCLFITPPLIFNMSPLISSFSSSKIKIEAILERRWEFFTILTCTLDASKMEMSKNR